MELMLVLAIVVITGALAVPLIENMLAGNKLTAAADVVKSRLNDMRTRAQESNEPFKLSFAENGNVIVVEPVNAVGDELQTQRTELPKDIVILGCNAINCEDGSVESITELVVQGDGTTGSPAQDFEISVGSGPGDTRPIIVRFGRDGAIKSSYANEGGNKP